MLYFASFDPGSPTGTAVFTETGELILSLDIKYRNAMQYMIEVKRIEELYPLAFVFIEEYLTFRYSGQKRFNSFKSQTQVQLLKEIFSNHIMVNPGQWNSAKFTEPTKKDLCEDIFDIPVTNSHKRDAALMGNRSYEMAKYQVGPQEVFNALNTMALIKHKWPTQQEVAILTWWEEINYQYPEYQPVLEIEHV